jgi:dual specificity MAP kinase phosphatase
MCTMSRASEISNNVWLGSTADGELEPTGEQPGSLTDIFIEASDLAQVPDPSSLRHVVELLDQSGEPQMIDFPSSGSIMPPTWSTVEVDGILNTCRWIYQLANCEELEDFDGKRDTDGDSQMGEDSTPRRFLIHCQDGYTESTLLALAYTMFAEGMTVGEAWLYLHCEKGRNFFAYPSDLALLQSMQSEILKQSPKTKEPESPNLERYEPQWLQRMDGSLPSRILPYMYLGNLGHANNPELLAKMGIKRVLSVGEPVSWSREEEKLFGAENLMFIDQVQDNGVDPLTDEFHKCLDFIEKGKEDGSATLVHCRVGVSRSATICIAEVMKTKGLSFPRA